MVFCFSRWALFFCMSFALLASAGGAAFAMSPPPSRAVNVKTSHDCVQVQGGWTTSHPVSWGTFNKGPAVEVVNNCGRNLTITSYVEFRDGQPYVTGAPEKLPRTITPATKEKHWGSSRTGLRISWGSRFEIRGTLDGFWRKEGVVLSGRIIHPGDVRYSLDYFRENLNSDDPADLLPYADFLARSSAPAFSGEAESIYLRAASMLTGSGAEMGKGENASYYRWAAIALADAYDKSGRYDEAYTWYENAGRVGDHTFHCHLAYYREKGLGRERSELKALQYWIYEGGISDTARAEANQYIADAYHAAKNGDTAGQLGLAWVYFRSYCAQYSDVADVFLAKAKDILNKLSKAGNADADAFMGHLYGVRFSGEGEAANWYLKSAARGSKAGQLQSVYLYRRGLGVAKDRDKADKILRDLAAGGYAPAQYKLGEYYARKDAQIADAYFWISLAYKNGFGEMLPGFRDGNKNKRPETDRTYARIISSRYLTHASRMEMDKKVQAWVPVLK